MACAATQCHSDTQARAAAGCHLWVHGPAAARVCVDAQCLRDHRRPCVCQDLGPCWCLRARRVLGLCQSECPCTATSAMVTSRPGCCQGHVWVYGSTMAGVCADVQVPYCHQSLHRRPGLGPQPEALVVSGVQATPRTIPICMASAVTRSQDVVQPQHADPCLGP